MTYSFLLIGDKMESMWPLIVEQAVSTLGTFRVASEAEAISAVRDSHYDLIMIDSNTVHNSVALITLLRTQQSAARIVVATASPTWQRAREALQAGAVDYIRKSLDQKQLRARVQSLLDGNLEPE